MKAYVQLNGCGKVGERKSVFTPHARLRFKHKGKAMIGGPVASGETLVNHWDVPLDFSQTMLVSCALPPSTISNVSDLVEVDYEVVVRLKLPVFHRKIQLSIPVMVGTHTG